MNKEYMKPIQHQVGTYWLMFPHTHNGSWITSWIGGGRVMRTTELLSTCE